MRILVTDQFTLTLPERHRFPIEKYSLLRHAISAEGLTPPGEFFVPDPATDVELLMVHDADYVAKVLDGTLDESELRRIGFPWSPELVQRSRRSVGATIAACKFALEDGVAVSLAGGTHHGFPDRGEGFCVFNDTAVAVRAVQGKRMVERVLVVDCDVHQGNGTARIFSGDPAVFTFGLYGANNFPFKKEKPDMGIPLEDGTGDEVYLAILRESLAEAIEIARPDLAIYLAGADPYEHDSLGRLGLTKSGLAARDRAVLGLLGGVNVPVAITMAGGYAKDIQDTVDIHLETVRVALSSLDA
ncbi:MAG: histone deacetylase [Gemmatimonadales bacterium]